MVVRVDRRDTGQIRKTGYEVQLAVRQGVSGLRACDERSEDGSGNEGGAKVLGYLLRIMIARTLSAEGGRHELRHGTKSEPTAAR